MLSDQGSARMGYWNGFVIHMLNLAVFVGSVGNSQEQAPSEASNVILVQNASTRFRDRVNLSCDRPGIVSKLMVREGDIVEAKATLATLEDSVPKTALAVAEAEANSDVEIRLAEKKFESTSLEYQAVVSANRQKNNAYSDSEVQRLKINAESAKIEIEFQKYKLQLAKLRRDQAQAELASFHLHAPFEGIVTKVQKNVGEAVSQQDALLELVGTKHVCVDGYVDLESALLVHAGDIAEVVFDSPSASDSKTDRILGRLRFVDVTFQRVRGVVRVIADFENKNVALRDGLNVTMRIRPNSSETVDLKPMSVEKR